MSDRDDPTLRAVIARMDDLERSVAKVLRDGLAEVRKAVEHFATTKADRTDVEALRRDIDDLKRASGE